MGGVKKNCGKIFMKNSFMLDSGLKQRDVLVVIEKIRDELFH